MVNILDLSEPQNHRCCYCGLPMIRHVHVQGKGTPLNAATKDHVEPKSYGGPTEVDNMVAACYQCNRTRGELDAVAFFNLLQKWFKRHPNLREDWHQLTYPEWSAFKIATIRVQARQLEGLGRRSQEHAFRHMRLVCQWCKYNLRLRA